MRECNDIIGSAKGSQISEKYWSEVGKEKRVYVYLEVRKRREEYIFWMDELDKNSQRTWLSENLSRWNGLLRRTWKVPYRTFLFFHIHVLSFIETWLKHSTPDRDIELNSFSVPLRKERVESSYGAVAVYIKETVHYWKLMEEEKKRRKL
jgi:hypothetical protein